MNFRVILFSAITLVGFSVSHGRAETPTTWPDKMPSSQAVTKMFGAAKKTMRKAGMKNPQALVALGAIETADFAYYCTKIEADFRTGRLSADARRKSHARNIARKLIDAGIDVIEYLPFASKVVGRLPYDELLHDLVEEELADLIQPEVDEVLRELDAFVAEAKQLAANRIQQAKEESQWIKDESKPIIDASKEKAKEAGQWMEKTASEAGSALRNRWERLR